MTLPETLKKASRGLFSEECPHKKLCVDVVASFLEKKRKELGRKRVNVTATSCVRHDYCEEEDEDEDGTYLRWEDFVAVFGGEKK